jgi:hypothetical protein
METAGSSGLQLVGAARAGRAGRWWRATTAAGEARGALLLDPPAIAAPGARDRLVSTVVATRWRPGVLPIADLVSDAGQVWLITAVPAEPTVAELLTGPGLDPVAALAVATGTAGALVELHRGGLVHGGFGPETAVAGQPGTVALIEVGLLPALRGEPVPPAADQAAWAALARTLAGGLAGQPAADLLRRAAAAAESGGLAAALRTLREAVARPAPGAPDRHPDTGAAERGTEEPGTAERSTEEPGAAEAGAVEAVTQLGHRAAASGGRAAAGAQRANLRFGPGVQAARRPPGWPAARPRSRRRRWPRTLGGGLLTLAILAGVAGYLWWERQNPLVVTAAVVAPAEPPGDRCDVTVDVVGTVQTNGRGGTVTYQWIRSDGEISTVLDQSVPEGSASTQVHLFWSFSGQGRYRATATLKILAPTPIETSGEFTYACG